MSEANTSGVVVITGITGLVGARLSERLSDAGYEVRGYSRNPQGRPGLYAWNPSAGEIDATALDGATAVVHLAGDNIADGRWTEAKKERIRQSRVDGTRLIAETIAAREQKPGVLVSASAIGWYGDRGDERLDESSAPGEGFLPIVCQQWEEAAKPAADAGVRVVNLRIGVVISTHGGALQKMLLPFRLGAGGVVGSGEQLMSWVDLDDVVGAIQFAIEQATLDGPVNATAPQPATNREFTKTLGSVLRRPTIIPMPGFAARLAFGELADDLMLSGAKIHPRRLHEAGYQFAYPELELSLRHVIGDKV